MIRALDASDTPFVGLLVTRGDGVAVQLDAAALGGWVGWGFAGAEHVVAPLDLVRRVDGHDVLLPWCTERVSTLLARRFAVDEQLALGECSTLVVSMLRGIDEVGEVGGAQPGAWWVTSEGRPVFVFGEGGSGACVETARILDLVAEGCRDRAMGRLLAQVQRGLHLSATQPRVPRRQIEEWERDLLLIAAPRPLRCDLLTPERARDVARAAHARPVEVSGVGGRTTHLRRRTRRESRVRRDVVHGLFASLSGRAADAVATMTRALVHRRAGESAATQAGFARRAQSPQRGPRSRRRALVVAGAAAAAVLAGGMLWPSSDPGTDVAEGATDRGPASPTPTVTAAPVDSVTDGAETHDGGGVQADSPVQHAELLLARAADCGEDSTDRCADVVAAGSTVTVSALGAIAASGPTLEIVDEYGDIAVVRAVGSVSAGGHIIVLVRTEEKWLVRDVYDVADQPE